MVGVLISIWSAVGGSRSVVDGLWSVVGSWAVGGGFVLRPLREIKQGIFRVITHKVITSELVSMKSVEFVSSRWVIHDSYQKSIET